jgi:hypothetical protein
MGATHERRCRASPPSAARCSKTTAAPVTPLELKADTYVLETGLHFPTDLNLPWDAGRKCIDWIEKPHAPPALALPGWRKVKDWRRLPV